MSDDLIGGLLAADQRNYHPIPDQGTDRVDAAPWSAIAQGLTFGGADEAEAWVRSMKGEDYDTALADVRDRLRNYNKTFPGESLSAEIGGAALPTIIASLFTGGGAGAASAAKLLPQLAKVAGLAATEGATYAFNTGEGGFGQRMARTPGGGALGFVGGAAGYTVGKTAVRGGARLFDYVRRKMGARVVPIVEKELRRVMKDAGIDSVDEAIDMIADGQILSDNATLAAVAKGYRAVSSEADEVFQGVYGKAANPSRQAALRKEVMDYLQDGLTDGADGNVIARYTADEAATKAARSADYNNAFAAVPDVGDELAGELAGAVRRVPSSQKDLSKLYRAKTGESPFFSFGDDGAVAFSRNPSLEESELVRRSIRDAGSREFRSGAGAVGSAIDDINKGLKTQIDKVSPDLGAVRAEWAEIASAREAFDLGRKSISRGPDVVAMDFDEAARKGDAVLKAYRAGVADAYRAKSFTGSAASMPGLLANSERKEGAVLRNVFPEDNLAQMLGMARRADDAQQAANRILGGSETAVTGGRMAEQGGGLLEMGLDAATTGGHGSAIKLAHRALRALQPRLSPKEAAQIARLMVEVDPAVFKRAMTDTDAISSITGMAADFLERVSGTGSVSAGASMAVPAANALLPGLLGEY